MKNLTLYIGTIKKCLNANDYKKFGDVKKGVAFEERTKTTVTTFEYSIPTTEIVDGSAILVKTESDTMYELKLGHSLKEYLNIICDTGVGEILDHPENDDDIFYDRSSLKIYCEEKAKVLNLRKRKYDMLMDPRIKAGIEN